MMAIGVNTYPSVQTKPALLLGLIIILVKGHKYLLSCGDRNSFIFNSLFIHISVAFSNPLLHENMPLEHEKFYPCLISL